MSTCDDKYLQCLDKLLKIKQNICEYESNMLQEWYSIEHLNIFMNQRDYFDYVITMPKYKEMINTEMAFERELHNLSEKCMDF